MASNISGVSRSKSRSVRITPMSSADRYQDIQDRPGETINLGDTINIEGERRISGYTPEVGTGSQISAQPGIANAEGLSRIAGMTTQTLLSPAEQRDIKKTEALSDLAAGQKAEAEQIAMDRKTGAALEATAGVIRAIGGVINANSKYSSVIGQNNFDIQQSKNQALMVASDVHRQILKEQTKGKSRGQEALIAAVAQGQAASGDLAQTAISNEDVYAAENMMAMEINSMRQVFGLETQQRQLEASSRIAEINRDLEVAQAVAGGVFSLASAGVGVM